MKYKKLIILFFLFLSCIAYARGKDPVNISHDTIFIKAIDEYILSKRINFPCVVLDMEVDSAGFEIITLLEDKVKSSKGKGNLLKYNLADDKIKWIIKERATGIDLIDNNIYSNRGGFFVVYDSLGIKRMRFKGSYFEVKEDVALYYLISYEGMDTHNPVGTYHKMDIIKEESIWERRIPGEYGINDIIKINDSLFLFVQAGLHMVNINTGEGWTYRMYPGEQDFTKATWVNAIGVITYAAIGVGMFQYGGDMITSIESNALIENNTIYFSARDRLLSVDLYTGKENWATYFKPNRLAQSYVHKRDTVLHLINKGSAIYKGRLSSYGIPFLQSINSESGEKIKMKEFNSENGFIKDFLIEDTVFYLIKRDRLYKLNYGYQVVDSLNICNTNNDHKKHEIMHYFTPTNDFYTISGNNLVSSAEIFKDNIFAIVSNDTMLIINNDFRITKKIPFNSVYFKEHVFKDIVILSNNRNHINSVIIAYNKNDALKEIMKLDYKKKCIILNEKILFIEDNAIKIVDLLNLNSVFE